MIDNENSKNKFIQIWHAIQKSTHFAFWSCYSIFIGAEEEESTKNEINKGGSSIEVHAMLALRISTSLGRFQSFVFSTILLQDLDGTVWKEALEIVLDILSYVRGEEVSWVPLDRSTIRSNEELLKIPSNVSPLHRFPDKELRVRHKALLLKGITSFDSFYNIYRIITGCRKLFL